MIRKGVEFNPERDDETKMKFQMSNQENYYSRYYDVNTKKPTPELINNNLRTNYDFAHMFFKKPHKSILITPAILLYASKVDE